MWIYETVVSNSVGGQQSEHSAEPTEDKVDQADTFGLTSGDDEEDSACSVPPPPETPLPPPPVQLCEDEGLEIHDVLNGQMERRPSDAASKASRFSKVSSVLTGFSKSSETGSKRSKVSSSDAASKYSKSSYAQDIGVLNAIASTNSTALPEEEQGAIEVEAAGAGFSRKSTASLSGRVSVLSSDSSKSKEDDLKKASGKPVFWTKKRKMCWSVLAMIALLILVGGLTYGAVKNSKNNEQASVAALTAADEEETGVDIVNVDLTGDDTTNLFPATTTNPADTANPVATTANPVATESPVSSPTETTLPANSTQWQDGDNGPIFETTFPPGTPAPSPSATASGTAAGTTASTTTATTTVTSDGTFMPTEISCSSDHNLIVGATCDNDGIESWSAIRILYCFSRVRDGDWYWIRGADSDYDRWDYTEGSAEGMLDFAGIPEGNYLVSLVRDSMRPYDIILTEELVVPNCDTVAS